MDFRLLVQQGVDALVDLVEVMGEPPQQEPEQQQKCHSDRGDPEELRVITEYPPVSQHRIVVGHVGEPLEKVNNHICAPVEPDKPVKEHRGCYSGNDRRQQTERELLPELAVAYPSRFYELELAFEFFSEFQFYTPLPRWS